MKTTFIFKKKLTSLILIIAIILLVFCNHFMPHIIIANADNTAEIVMEVKTNRVVYASNENCKKYMASTTKILTAITIIENCDINKEITITKDTTGIEGSSIYLEEGERLTIKDLLYGLMLRSGNDCAETLAKHCSKTIENFAKLMNKTAEKIGAFNSNFVNPHGLHDDNHYTTAYDLALISCYAMKNDTFREIVGTKSTKIPFTTHNTVRLLINKNKILTKFSGGNGIKTGYTKKAGRCLVSSAKRSGIEFICVVLNCPDMFERSMNLLSKAFNDFENYKLVDSNNIVAFVDTKKGEKIALIIKNDIILPLTKNERDNIKIVYDIPNYIEKEVKNDKEVGFVEIYCKNNLIFKEKIYTIV